MNLSYVITKCREMGLQPIQEYISNYNIFFLRGSSQNLGQESPAVVRKFRQIYDQLVSDKDKYLQFDSLPSIQTPSEKEQVLNEDIVIGAFLHYCDTAFESFSTRIYSHKFSQEHYVDQITLIPEPSIPGLSRGLDKIGIVRDQLDWRSFSNFASPKPYLRSLDKKINDNPHFNIFITHNPKKDVVPSKNRSRITSLKNLQQYIFASHEPWPEDEVGIELLNVKEGRENCFECIVLLLLVMIKNQAQAVQDFGKGIALQKFTFEVFNVSTWKDLEKLIGIQIDHKYALENTSDSYVDQIVYKIKEY
jgi:hypothetical protein